MRIITTCQSCEREFQYFRGAKLFQIEEEPSPFCPYCGESQQKGPPKGEPIEFFYTNHRGEYGLRRVIPVRVRYGTSQNRPMARWLLDAWCLDRGAMRSFMLTGINRQVTKMPSEYVPPTEEQELDFLAQVVAEREARSPGFALKVQNALVRRIAGGKANA